MDTIIKSGVARPPKSDKQMAHFYEKVLPAHIAKCKAKKIEHINISFDTKIKKLEEKRKLLLDEIYDFKKLI